MSTAPPNLLALDIGGANLKAAHSSGVIRTAPFALWKHPERLGEALRSLTLGLDCDRVAVTMTGELCDCFATKADGVRAILYAVSDAHDAETDSVWGNDGRFHTFGGAINSPSNVAASNWLALATLAARIVPDGLLLDVGSTTADLIPIRGGTPVPAGRTDTDRLRSGELVYAGVRRTPLCALATALPHRGIPTGLMAELFASTLDVFLTLGRIADDPTDRDTADGRPATAEFARDRLARMVGADRDSFTAEDAVALATESDAVLVDRLAASARRVLGDLPPVFATSGAGEFLVKRVAERLGGRVVSLSERWGVAESNAACAYALMRLASELGDDWP